MIQYILLPVFILVAMATAENDTDKAIRFKNAEQMINNFTFNWTLYPPEINEERKNQMTLLTQPGTYSGLGGDDYYNGGANRGTVKQLINYYPSSSAFKKQLLQAADQCDFYMDHELVQEGTNLTFRKIGFIRLGKDIDNFVYLYTTITFGLIDISQETNQFLACAARYQADESQCVLPPQLSKFDWIGFKIWFNAYSTIQFMDDAGTWRDAILRMVEMYKQYLPPDYKPVDRCEIWPPNENKCDQVNNPKLSIAIGLAQRWNYTQLTPTQRLLVKIMIANETGALEQPNVNCGLAHSDVINLFNDWLSKKYVDQEFVIELNKILASKRVGDFYAIRDLFFSPAPKEVNYARVFIVRDNLPNQYHVGSIFYKVVLKDEMQKIGPHQCDPSLITCLFDKIRLAKNDQLFKSYVIEQAVDSFKAVKQIQPRANGNPGQNYRIARRRNRFF